MDTVYIEWHVIEALLFKHSFLTFMFVCFCFATSTLFNYFYYYYSIILSTKSLVEKLFVLREKCIMVD